MIALIAVTCIQLVMVSIAVCGVRVVLVLLTIVVVTVVVTAADVNDSVQILTDIAMTTSWC